MFILTAISAKITRIKEGSKDFSKNQEESIFTKLRIILLHISTFSLIYVMVKIPKPNSMSSIF